MRCYPSADTDIRPDLLLRYCSFTLIGLRCDQWSSTTARQKQ